MTAFVEMSPWVLVLLVFGAVLLMLAALRAYQLWASPEPELVRKLFHLGGGLFGLSLPWLFRDMPPVLVLAGAVALLFVAMRTIPALREGIGQVLAGVQRRTIGEFCFVVSFCLLFWLSEGNKLLYGIPLLVLAIADSAAAIIGVEYGKYHFTAWKGHKSLEGSVAFFFAAFFCVHVPVLLLTDTPRPESLLIAVNLAVMVMMAELAAWWGLDNLIIPLFGFALLKSFLPMDAIQLAQHLAFLLSLSLFIRFWRHRTTLADDALFGTSLWGYVVWALADWHWFMSPFLLILTYTSVSERTPVDLRRTFNFPVALANIAPGLVWLLLYRASGREAFFYPFTVVFAADLAIIALVRHSYAFPKDSRGEVVAYNAGKGVLLLAAIVLIRDGFTIPAALNALVGAVAVTAAAALFTWLQPNLARYPVATPRWLRQAAIVMGASALPLIPHLTIM